MKNERKIIVFVAGALLLAAGLVLAGCSPAPGKTSTPSTAAGNVVVASDDGSVAISVPDGWNTDDTSLSSSAVIRVSNKLDSQYVTVVRRAKSDFANDFTLKNFMTDIKKDFELVLTDPVWGPVSSTTTGGCDTLSVKLNGTTAHGIDLTYWISVVEGKKNYYCISGWTPQSKANLNEQVIKDVIASFKER
jgi:hypothetical protein